jgi:hypothetical protein
LVLRSWGYRFRALILTLCNMATSMCGRWHRMQYHSHGQPHVICCTDSLLLPLPCSCRPVPLAPSSAARFPGQASSSSQHYSTAPDGTVLGPSSREGNAPPLLGHPLSSKSAPKWKETTTMVAPQATPTSFSSMVSTSSTTDEDRSVRGMVDGRSLVMSD